MFFTKYQMPHGNRGTLMLVLLVVIMVAGLIGTQFVPATEARTVHAKQTVLMSSLANIRMAMDLERLQGTGSPCAAEYASLTANPDNKPYVENYLKKLETYNFLRSSQVHDPFFAPDHWGSGDPGLRYWDARQNCLQPLIASNGMSSFEAGWVYDNDVGTLSAPGWKNVLDPSQAIATLAVDTPSAFDSTNDDYHGQNKFGQVLGVTGYCLRIEKK